MDPPLMSAGGPPAPRAPNSETQFGAGGGGMMPVTTPGKPQPMINMGAAGGGPDPQMQMNMPMLLMMDLGNPNNAFRIVLEGVPVYALLQDPELQN